MGLSVGVWIIMAGVGAIAGLLGIGGGFIMVPLLMDGLGMPMPISLGISSLAGLLIALVASFVRQSSPNQRRLVFVRHAFVLGLGAAVFSYIGARLAPYVDILWIRILFVCLLSYLIFRSISTMRFQESEQGPLNHVWNLRAVSAGVIIIPVIGLMSGLLAVGGGVFYVPLLYGVLGLSIQEASATSSLAVILTTAGSVIGMVPILRTVDSSFLHQSLFACVLGAGFGTFFGYRIPNRFLAGLAVVMQSGVLINHLVKIIISLIKS